MAQIQNNKTASSKPVPNGPSKPRIPAAEAPDFDAAAARQQRSNAAARFGPQDAERFIRLAMQLLRDEDLVGAVACAEVATMCDPQHFAAWLALGTANARAKRFRQGAAAFLRAAEQRPDDVVAWTDAGECYVQLRDYEAAAQCLRQAMENDPQAKHPAGRRARALVGRTIALLKRG